MTETKFTLDPNVNYVVVYEPPTKKYCRVGRHMVVESHFHSDASKPDGLCEWCKDCSNIKKQDWRRRNADVERDIRNRARAREAGVHFDTVDYEDVRDASDGLCYLCREIVDPRNEVFDHKIPLSVGGTHTQDNLGLVHASCNTRKGKRTPAELTWKVVW